MTFPFQRSGRHLIFREFVSLSHSAMIKTILFLAKIISNFSALIINLPPTSINESLGRNLIIVNWPKLSFKKEIEEGELIKISPISLLRYEQFSTLTSFSFFKKTGKNFTISIIYQKFLDE